MLSSVITWVLVIAFTAVAVGVLVAQSRRTRMQRVVLEDGVLSTSEGVSGRLNGLPVDRIGTVVLLPERNARVGEGSQGIWTWGGILILDTDGRVVRRIVHVPGSTLPIAQIAEQIPAPRHVELESHDDRPYRRSDLLTQFPHALRPLEMRGALWISLAVVLVVFVGLPLVIGIGAFIGVMLTALVE